MAASAASMRLGTSPASGHALAGAAWAALNTATVVVVPLALFVLFARSIPAATFGTLSLAVAATEVLKGFGAPGLYEALLGTGADDARKHETAVALLLGASGLLLAAYVLSASAYAFGNGVDGWTLLAFCAIGFRIPFDLLCLQPQARLAQGLRFKQLGLRTIVGSAGAGLVGAAFLLAGKPVAGFAAYQLAQSVLIFLVTVLSGQVLSRPRLHADAWAALRGEAFWATTVRAVATANNWLDQVVVGLLVGSTPLGLYALGKRCETAFITAASSFSSILFQPAFARAEPGRRGTPQRHALAVTTATSGLLAAFLVVNCGDVVTALFGPQWAAAAPLVALSALSGFARALGGVHGALLSVSGRNRQLLVLSGAAAVVGVLCLLVGVQFGLVWAAGALLLKNVGAAVSEAVAASRDARDTGRAYLLVVLLPFAAMVFGAVVGRAAAAHAGELQLIAVGATWNVLATLASSAAVATACGVVVLAGPYYEAWRPRRPRA